MIKTYIYGTPKGFNLYEKDSEAAADFQLFYSTSRRTRRMMVQRSPSGVTRYNYLQYDITDSGGRPHGFFGMTLQVDGFEYSPDLKTVYAWFEHVFYNKILKETSLFSVMTNEFGAVTGIRYNVSFFAQNSSEVEMIRSILPNIFSVNGGLPLVGYDASYGVGAQAEIAGINPEEDPAIVESVFKKYSWVSISEKYPLLSGGSSAPSIELDYGDLKKQEDVYKDELLNVATGQEKDPSGKLEEIKTGIEAVMEKITAYAQVLSSKSDEYKSFEELFSEYGTLLNTVLSLFPHKEQVPTPVPAPVPADEKKPKQTRRCVRCHKELPLRDFAGYSQICRDCKSKLEAEEARKRNRIVVAVAAVAVMIVGAAWLLWPEKKLYVDRAELESAISGKRYDDAVALLNGRADSADYVAPIKEAVSAELDAMAKSEDGMKGLEELYQSRKGVLNIIGGESDKEKWEALIADYKTLSSYLNKGRLTKSDIKQAEEIIKKHPEYLAKYIDDIKPVSPPVTVRPSDYPLTYSIPEEKGTFSQDTTISIIIGTKDGQYVFTPAEGCVVTSDLQDEYGRSHKPYKFYPRSYNVNIHHRRLTVKHRYGNSNGDVLQTVIIEFTTE